MCCPSRLCCPVLFVCLVRLSCAVRLVCAVRLSVLCCPSVCPVCLLCVMSLSVCAMLCYAMLCYAVRLSRASISCVYLVRLFCSSCSSLVILPPERFTPLHIRVIRVFDSYNPLSGSSGSSGSIRLPLHAFQRVKINFFKLMGKPRRIRSV